MVNRLERGGDDNDSVVMESPMLSKNVSKRSLSNPSHLKVFTGTSFVEEEKAHRTYLNEIGPGQYNLPKLTGRHSIESKRRNIPNISFASNTKMPWN